VASVIAFYHHKFHRSSCGPAYTALPPLVNLNIDKWYLRLQHQSLCSLTALIPLKQSCLDRCARLNPNNRLKDARPGGPDAPCSLAISNFASRKMYGPGPLVNLNIGKWCLRLQHQSPCSLTALIPLKQSCLDRRARLKPDSRPKDAQPGGRYVISKHRCIEGASGAV
jgi:hypothetical protein